MSLKTRRRTIKNDKNNVQFVAEKMKMMLMLMVIFVVVFASCSCCCCCYCVSAIVVGIIIVLPRIATGLFPCYG